MSFDNTNESNCFKFLYDYSYNNQPNFPIIDDLFENPLESRHEISFDPFPQPESNVDEYLTEKCILLFNETDRILGQKSTSDKSNNNSNHLSNDKDLKLDLNEIKEKGNSSSINQKDINIINPNTQKGPFNIIKKNKLGRKRKISCHKGVHDKFSYDNMTKKLKKFLLNSILKFVNSFIIKEEEMDTSVQKRKKNNKCKVISKSILFQIDQNIIKDITREYNINLLNLTLKEIFSKDITLKIKKKEKDSNKKLIEEIYLKNKKKKTINILNMRLNQCIEHLTNKVYYPELQGLENEYEKIINELKKSGETDEYIKLFEDLFRRFEEYYRNKRKQKSNKNSGTKRQK